VSPAETNVDVDVDARVRLVTSRADRRIFLGLPYRLHAHAPAWVAPLRRDQAALLDARRNAFFAHGRMALFLAEDARGAAVGRVAAIVNGRHLATHADGTGFVGFFECPDAPLVAAALLGQACDWLHAQGLTRALGPVSPTLNDVSGCLVDGFDRPPSIMMPWNPPHHEALYLGAGFRRATTQWAYHGAWKHLDRARLARGVALVERRHPELRVRTAELRRFDAEIAVLRDLYTRCFAGTWGFVPPTEAEFAQMARAMRPVIDPRIVFILEQAGRPVGFSLSLPNVNQLLAGVRDGRLFPLGIIRLLLGGWLGAISEFRTLLLGIVPELRRLGLDALLVHATIEDGRRAGYAAGELGWVADDNTPMRNLLARLGAVVDKQYALFEKPLL
jgi:GNAT superfamily N-acetyltransferase